MTTRGKRRALWVWWPLMTIGVVLILAGGHTMTLNGAGLLGLALAFAGVLGMSTEVKE